MAYARWSHSAWYIYWSASSGEAKEEQLLECMHVGGGAMCLRYGDIKGRRITREVAEKMWQNATGRGLSTEDAEDLAHYIRTWVDDIEARYEPRWLGTTTFGRYSVNTWERRLGWYEAELYEMPEWDADGFVVVEVTASDRRSPEKAAERVKQVLDKLEVRNDTD